MLRFHHHTSTSFLSQLIPSSTQLSCSCSSMFHELFIQFSPSHRNTAHSHVTHMSFLTLSLRPHQHPSLRSITLLSTFSTLHSRYVLVSIHHFGPFHSCSSSQLTHTSLSFFKTFISIHLFGPFHWCPSSQLTSNFHILSLTWFTTLVPLPYPLSHFHLHQESISIPQSFTCSQSHISTTFHLSSSIPWNFWAHLHPPNIME